MYKPILIILAFVLLLTSACNLPDRSKASAAGRMITATAVVVATQAAPATVQPASGPRETATATATAITNMEFDPARFVAYTAQPGDTLAVVAAHFGVASDQIHAYGSLPAQGLLSSSLVLIIPRPVEPAPYAQFLLPDSEAVNSPCGRAFNVPDFVSGAGGTLSTYSQVIDGSTLSGAEVVERVAAEMSVNPRLLLAFIEQRSGWVTRSIAAPDLAHPLGLNIAGVEGLYLELSTYAQLLDMGYYGWRQGKLAELSFADGTRARIAPELNAGTVSLQYLFARSFGQAAWQAALYGPQGFLATYMALFGNLPYCAADPLFPDGLQAPDLELPFTPGEPWALTGGLHEDWTTGTPQGALDFAPITGEPPCAVSRTWALASAAGMVTRSERGVVQLALIDSTGQPTGWELLYMHLANAERAPLGTRVKTDDRLGHPSCEGGQATGAHVHLARLYHGEWIGAGDPLPYALSGWLAAPGASAYRSSLMKGSQVVTADVNGSKGAWITR